MDQYRNHQRHVGTLARKGGKIVSQPIFNISRFFGKMLAGVPKFSYLCNAGTEIGREQGLRIEIARFKSRNCAY